MSIIKVKIIKKPKNEGMSSALQTSGSAYQNMAVKEAKHAARADISELAREATHAQEATHAIDADKAQEANHSIYADEAKNADTWDYREFDDYLDQGVKTDSSPRFKELTTDSLQSTGKVSTGLTGAGFRLWKDIEGLANLSLDRLTVRQTMTVFELLIEKVRSVGGQICVSAANGKISKIEETDDEYSIYFEKASGYVEHDLIRCQTFSKGHIKSYWVEVSTATPNGDCIMVSKDEFVPGMKPEVGDETVLMGNTHDTTRQNMVLISATEDGIPRVDVQNGIKGKTFDNTLRARLGSLKDIRDSKFPEDSQPHGDGLYADNAYLRGTFVLSSGEDVKTRLEAIDGRITSSIDGLRRDMAEDSFLRNATFRSGLLNWQTNNTATFYSIGSGWIWANETLLSRKGKEMTSATTYDGRNCVHIEHNYIKQLGVDMDTSEFDGNVVKTVYLSFFYRCNEKGVLKICFEDVEKGEEFESLQYEEEIDVTSEYVYMKVRGLWNGTGNFKLSFTGDIYLTMLVMSTDETETLKYQYKTLFEQSDNLLRLSAAVYGEDKRLLSENGLMVKAEYAGMYAINENGDLASFVGTSSTGNVKIKASKNISLEGVVTANRHFKIDEDGNMEAVDGRFSGTITATEGSIGGLTICSEGIGVDKDSDGMRLDGESLWIQKDGSKSLFVWPNTNWVERIVNTEQKTGGSTSNIGTIYSIDNGPRNFACIGKGSMCMNGRIDGYRVNYMEVKQPTDGDGVPTISITDCGRTVVEFSGSSGGVCLPSLESVRLSLGMERGDTTPFCMEQTLLTVFTKQEIAYKYYIYGKGEYINNSDNLPLIAGATKGRYELKYGKYVCRVFLCYYNGVYRAFIERS